MSGFFRSSKFSFIARSPDRDRETDAALVAAVLASIEEGIGRFETERAGLQNRVDDLLARTAIVAGNEMDEYITRSDERSKMLRESEQQISGAQRRLAMLKENISHFTFIKASLKSRFPSP